MVRFKFVGVDWGTSSFRAWLCRPDAKPLLLHKSARGMSRLKPDEFAPYLEQILRNAAVPITMPVIICGMAGARDGWQEVPYVSVPATQSDVQHHATQLTAGSYGCTILPGVCLAADGRYDVMRGEETLLFGALSTGVKDGMFCLPGTHSKWCRIDGGVLTGWQTVMTGELFALLSSQSTLSGFCGTEVADFHQRPAFKSAVREVLDGEASALHHLFSIRARALLDENADHADFPARLSGLLIGQEISGLNLDSSAPIVLISNGSICEAYCAALSIAGYDVEVIDAEVAALVGLAVFAGALVGGALPAVQIS